MKSLIVFFSGVLFFLFDETAVAQNIDQLIDQKTEAIKSKVIEWRRYLHQHPELSNREYATAQFIAQHLRQMGLDVQTGVAHTGVVGLLAGGKPGPVVGLRADMDALPVVERVNIPFASKVTSTYDGLPVGVMHACGHDTHVAILLGVAEVLSEMKSYVPGTVKFIFQPAEEGAPPGEKGGAELMVQEGVLDSPKVAAMFGLHINSAIETGTIKYRSGAMMAASDWFTIKVKGKQSHGSQPWSGIDPVVVSAQIIEGLQTIISRQTELTKAAAVITVGSIHSGVRSNIIPEAAEMKGTIRTLDKHMRNDILERIQITATKIAESAGATASVDIVSMTPVTYNDPFLVQKMLPSLQKLVGKDHVLETEAVTGAEDFGFYAQKVPSFFFFLGGMPKGGDPKKAPPHHTPDFYIDDSGLDVGVKAFCRLVFDYAADR